MNKAKIFALPALVISMIGVAQATLAQTFSPQSGTWAIDEENNGKPGRGFQIDVQNDILVLYFYGYEQTGESTYWLAAGRIPAGSNQLTADLGEYEGGMAFGDPIKNATYLGSRGKVTIRFSAVARGEICLPSEACKAISAFNFGFENSASALLGGWLVTTVDSTTQELDAYAVDFTDVVATPNPNAVDRAVGTTYIELDDGSFVETDVACDKLINPLPLEYFCTLSALGHTQKLELNVKRNGMGGQYYEMDGVKLEGSVIGTRLMNESGRYNYPN